MSTPTRHDITLLNRWSSIRENELRFLDQRKDAAAKLAGEDRKLIERELAERGFIIVEHLRGVSMHTAADAPHWRSIAEIDGFVGRELSTHYLPTGNQPAALRLLRANKAEKSIQQAEERQGVINVIVAIKTAVDSIAQEIIDGDVSEEDLRCLLPVLRARLAFTQRAIRAKIASQPSPAYQQ